VHQTPVHFPPMTKTIEQESGRFLSNVWWLIYCSSELHCA
jgi:hypothetical protein